MLSFLLLWVLGSSFCCAIAATVATLSSSEKIWQTIGLSIVTYWILYGIVQWIVLAPYLTHAYQWSLVTSFGGMLGSGLIALAFYLFVVFLFKDAEIVGLGGSGPSAKSLFAALFALILLFFIIGFLLGLGQNLIFQYSGIKTNIAIPILTGLTWLFSAILCMLLYLFLANYKSIEFIIYATFFGTIITSVKGLIIGIIFNNSGFFLPDELLGKALAKIGAFLALGAIFFYPFRYRLLEFLGATETLHRAVAAGRISVEQYVAGGGNINWDEQENFFLHQAVVNENEFLIEFLLQRGADINQPDRQGYLLIHKAKNKKIAEYLLSRGSNVNSQNNWGNTPLHSSTSKKEVVELLLAKGADPNIRNNQGQTPIHHILINNINALDSLEILIANGADVNARDLKGLTPLYYSITKTRFTDSPSLIQQRAKVAILLIEHGADVNIQDSSGNSPLHLTGNIQIIKSLIAHGADINARDAEGRTPLHARAKKEAIEVLIAHGADVNARNKYGGTPLHLAHDKETAELLLKHGAEINSKNNYGRTPLLSVSLDFIANRYGSRELAKFLLANGADVNDRDNEGKNLLHYIVNARVRDSEFSLLKEFVGLLIEYSADINAVDNEGRTPMDVEILHQKELQKMYRKELPIKDKKLEIMRSYGGVCSKYC